MHEDPLPNEAFDLVSVISDVVDLKISKLSGVSDTFKNWPAFLEHLKFQGFFASSRSKDVILAFLDIAIPEFNALTIVDKMKEIACYVSIRLAARMPIPFSIAPAVLALFVVAHR